MLTLIEVETIPRPLWINAAQAESVFGLSAAQLRKVAAGGSIRWAKTSDARQAGRIYNVRDVNEWIASRACEAMAADDADEVNE